MAAKGCRLAGSDGKFKGFVIARGHKSRAELLRSYKLSPANGKWMPWKSLIATLNLTFKSMLLAALSAELWTHPSSNSAAKLSILEKGTVLIGKMPDNGQAVPVRPTMSETGDQWLIDSIETPLNNGNCADWVKLDLLFAQLSADKGKSCLVGTTAGNGTAMSIVLGIGCVWFWDLNLIDSA